MDHFHFFDGDLYDFLDFYVAIPEILAFVCLLVRNLS
jgi:hypothetical protein